MPMHIFNFFINTLKESKSNYKTDITENVEFDPEATLSFKKLQSLQQIYNRCPVSTKGYTNNSNNFRNACVMAGFKDDIAPESND